MSLHCTVGRYLDVLSHELVRHDVRTSAREAQRGHVNIYRLDLLMEALGKVRARTSATSPRTATPTRPASAWRCTATSSATSPR